jgi:hypothetical protein
MEQVGRLTLIDHPPDRVHVEQIRVVPTNARALGLLVRGDTVDVPTPFSENRRDVPAETT